MEESSLRNISQR